MLIGFLKKFWRLAKQTILKIVILKIVIARSPVYFVSIDNNFI